MEMDPETGKLVWEDPVEGRYEIKIKVVAVIDGEEIIAYQEFVLEIGDGESENEEEKRCARIAGSVNWGGP